MTDRIDGDAIRESRQGQSLQEVADYWHSHPFRLAIMEFVEHYHCERSHQGLDNRLIAGTRMIDLTGRVRHRPRLGGVLNFYGRQPDGHGRVVEHYAGPPDQRCRENCFRQRSSARIHSRSG